MTDPVYKLIEVTGTSGETVEKAVENAVARASTTVREMRWFQVMETRGRIQDQRVTQYQVTLKIGFRLEDGS